MNSKLRTEQMEQLLRAIASIDNLEDCSDFFEDLCTVTELKAFAQRFQVAKMLLANRVYSDIVKETGASTATISRVNRSLSFGTDGYKKILEREN